MKLPLEHMEAKVTLQDGRIRVDPARVDLAGGKVETASASMPKRRAER